MRMSAATCGGQRHQSPWSRSYRWFWAAMWALRLELRSSARTVCALHHWGISPAPKGKFKEMRGERKWWGQRTACRTWSSPTNMLSSGGQGLQTCQVLPFTLPSGLAGPVFWLWTPVWSTEGKGFLSLDSCLPALHVVLSAPCFNVMQSPGYSGGISQLVGVLCCFRLDLEVLSLDFPQ